MESGAVIVVGVDFLNVSAVDLAFDDSRVGSGEDIERDGVPVEIKTRLRARFFSASLASAAVARGSSPVR